jgi:hypothetical protein
MGIDSRGDLVVGQLLEVLEPDDLALARVEAVDGAPDLPRLPDIVHGVIGRRGVGLAQLRAAVAALAASDVDRGAPGDAVAPWRQRTCSVVAVARAMP